MFHIYNSYIIKLNVLFPKNYYFELSIRDCKPQNKLWTILKCYNQKD